jgi:hypothetical protein
MGGFVFGNPNLWYGAYFPYVPKQRRWPDGVYSPYVPKLSRWPEGAYSPYVPKLSNSPQARVPSVMPGSLQLNTVPGRAQVYVDDFYVGVVDDFGAGGRRLNLDPGPHRVLLRASGYYDLAFDVYIEPGRTMVYQGDMGPLPTAPPRVVPQAPPGAAVPPGTAAPPRTMYVIPNCYAGDIPPAGALPAGCNIRDMRARRLN